MVMKMCIMFRLLFETFEITVQMYSILKNVNRKGEPSEQNI
jgi:hypothetical protein